MLECVVNISEGRDLQLIASLAHDLGSDVLDIHSDPDHNRSVLTLLGTSAPRILASQVLSTLTLQNHDGVHPRLGVLDVVPFVPLHGSTMDDALAARDDFAHWIADTHGVPVFLYGPSTSLPELRRSAWNTRMPDIGPQTAHVTAGAVCVGAREPLVAWNMWLENTSIERTRHIAAQVRSPEIRTLGLQVGAFTQVSCNLIAPLTHGPAVAYDRVAALTPIARCELVGLVPRDVVDVISADRWETLDLDVTKTIEWRRQHGRSNCATTL